MDSGELKATKSRGLGEALKFAGDITGEIERRAARGGTVRVLEVGCGYGMALLDLRRRYGDRVDLSGINLEPGHGNVETMRAVARATSLCPEGELRSLAPPEFMYFDVCHPWPVKSDSFDVVFSHHAFMWIGDKIKALEEAHRVLKPDGIALLDVYLRRREWANRPPQSLEIRENRHVIPFVRYARQFHNLRIIRPGGTPPQRLRQWGHRQAQRVWRWANRRIGRKVQVSVRIDPYLEMRKDGDLDFRLEFISSRPFSDYGVARKGCCSVYRLRESVG